MLPLSYLAEAQTDPMTPANSVDKKSSFDNLRPQAGVGNEAGIFEETGCASAQR